MSSKEDTAYARRVVDGLRGFSIEVAMQDVEPPTRRELMDVCVGILAECYMRTVERESYLPVFAFEDLSS